MSAPKYTKIAQVGQGTYGKVYKATSPAYAHPLALKTIRMESEHEGFPFTACRELKILREIGGGGGDEEGDDDRTEGLVRLLDVVVVGEDVSMVFEYFEFDLRALLSTFVNVNFSDCEQVDGRIGFGTPQPPPSSPSPAIIQCIKSIIWQLLRAVSHLHSRQIIHRDIKSSNVLIGRDGGVRLADFGLARRPKGINAHLSRDQDDEDSGREGFQESNPLLTNRTVTLWYRAPELALGSTQYNDRIDIWSIGCILVELLIGRPLFQEATDDLALVQLICERCGEVGGDVFGDLPWFAAMKAFWPTPDKIGLEDWVDSQHLDICKKLLSIDPKNRPSAEAALEHAWFKDLCGCTADCKLLVSKHVEGLSDSHEYQIKYEQ